MMSPAWLLTMTWSSGRSRRDPAQVPDQPELQLRMEVRLRLLDHHGDVELVRENASCSDAASASVWARRASSRADWSAGPADGGSVRAPVPFAPPAAGSWGTAAMRWTAPSRDVRDGREGDRDVQQVDVPETGHLEPLGRCAIVDGPEQQFQHPGQIRVVDVLATDERVVRADPRRHGRQVFAHALLDRLDEPDLGQLLEQRRGLIPHIEEVAVAALRCCSARSSSMRICASRRASSSRGFRCAGR